MEQIMKLVDTLYCPLHARTSFVKVDYLEARAQAACCFVFKYQVDNALAVFRETGEEAAG